jgi:colicin import membrane protein
MLYRTLLIVVAFAVGGGTLLAQNPLDVIPNPAKKIADLQRELDRARAEAEKQRRAAEDARKQAEAEKARALAALKEAQEAFNKATEGEAPAKPENDAIAALMKERIGLFEQIVVLEEKAMEAGRGSSERIFLAREQLARAQLDVAATEKERLAIHEKIVALARELEKVAEEHNKAGTVPMVDLLRAKNHRIEAEIALERARAMQSSGK